MSELNADVVTRWTGLPDPGAQNLQGNTCTIVVRSSTWEHVVRKHVANECEPWRDWLTRSIVANLAAGFADCSQVALALSQIGKDVKESLQRPLVLVYRTNLHGHTWLLVLPSGALAVVRSRQQANAVLSTCYFRKVVCRITKSAQRWRRLV